MTSHHDTALDAMDFIAANYQEQPSLAQVAAHVGLSKDHFQRVFRAWVGISPKQFLAHITLSQAKIMLANSRSTLATSDQLGLSSVSRLHDLMLKHEAMTPGTYKNQGQALRIAYGIHATPLGPVFLGNTERGVAFLSFVSDAADLALARAKQRLPKAQFVEAPEAGAAYIEQIFKHRAGEINLQLIGTAFQLKVWQALLCIPVGARLSYRDIASMIDQPGAARAVGSAVGANPLALLIPCHRVIRGDGGLGGYAWGLGQKLAVMGWESSVLGAK